MTVWICQCLCPSRHCILATVGEVDTPEEAENTVSSPLRDRIAELLASHTMNPWCALCDANQSTWRYELRRTRFQTMEEAKPVLMETEARNLATNATWGDLHKTSRPN